MSIQIPDLIQRIESNPAPVLFLDTCALLDIMNMPFDDRFPVSIIESVNRFLEINIVNQSSIWIVIAEQVEDEWNKKSNSVYEEISGEIKRARKQINKFRDIINTAGIEPGFICSDLYRFHLDDYLFDLSRQLISISYIIENNSDCMGRASGRVLKNEAPSRKGKGLPDCIIIEHYLEMCKLLRRNSFIYDLVFVSSNTKDYYEPDKPYNIKEPLKSQFSELNLQYVTNIAWASSIL